MDTFMQDIKAQVRRYINDNFMLGVNNRPLADADSFMEHHVLDSTGFLELIAFLEETFHIAVADEEMVPENLDSLDHVAAFLGRKRVA
jgi:acyl carrier protein